MWHLGFWYHYMKLNTILQEKSGVKLTESILQLDKFKRSLGNKMILTWCIHNYTTCSRCFQKADNASARYVTLGTVYINHCFSLFLNLPGNSRHFLQGFLIICTLIKLSMILNILPMNCGATLSLVCGLKMFHLFSPSEMHCEPFEGIG